MNFMNNMVGVSYSYSNKNMDHAMYIDPLESVEIIPATLIIIIIKHAVSSITIKYI